MAKARKTAEGIRIVCQGAVMRPAAALVPYVNNAKIHGEAQVEALRRSLREFGFVRPLLIDGADNLIAGHGTLQAAIAEGMPEVPCILAEGLTDAQRRAYILADNRLAEMAEWNAPMLDLELEALGGLGVDLDATGFRLDDLEVREDEKPEEDKHTGQEAHHEEEPPPHYPERCRRGDLWQLGRHRLMCGDCTQPPDKALLFGGAKPEILLTDPPYCSGGFQESGRGGGSVGRRARDTTVANDTLSTRGYQALMRAMLADLPAKICYIFTDWRMWVNLFDLVESAGFGVRNMLVWDKGSMGMGFGWRPQHELVMFALNCAAQFDPHKGYANVIACPRSGNKLHPTEKPAQLIRDILDNTAWAQGVFDPFAGSGTTLAACEEMGQDCYAMELMPELCDVILWRWEELTGGEAVKLN